MLIAHLNPPIGRNVLLDQIDAVVTIRPRMMMVKAWLSENILKYFLN
jgi:hypothetical protein